MKFEDYIIDVDERIGREYQKLIVKEYTPLFDMIKKKAEEHMNKENIRELQLGVTNSKLFFRVDKHFYHLERGHAENPRCIELNEIPEIYKKESYYIGGQADSRSHRTISYHETMREALKDFRNSLKKSLADII